MNESHMSSNESIIVMSICMIIAGIISGMNSFVDKPDDYRLNINDFYEFDDDWFNVYSYGYLL